MPVTEGNIRTRFSNELGFGKQGHEALIALNESEIKLLESVKSYIEKRARIDLEYVDKITKLHASYQSNGGGAAEEGGLINKVRIYKNIITIFQYLQLLIFLTNVLDFLSQSTYSILFILFRMPWLPCLRPLITKNLSHFLILICLHL